MKAYEVGLVTALDDIRAIMRECLGDVKETNFEVIIEELHSRLEDYLLKSFFDIYLFLKIFISYSSYEEFILNSFIQKYQLKFFQ